MEGDPLPNFSIPHQIYFGRLSPLPKGQTPFQILSFSHSFANFVPSLSPPYETPILSRRNLWKTLDMISACCSPTELLQGSGVRVK